MKYLFVTGNISNGIIHKGLVSESSIYMDSPAALRLFMYNAIQRNTTPSCLMN